MNLFNFLGKLRIFKRVKDYSYLIDLQCNEHKYRMLLNPKEIQGYSDFVCPECSQKFRISTCSFYGCGDDYLKIDDHKIWYDL